MLVDVIRLRDRGTKLTTEQVRTAEKIRGDLMVTTERRSHGNGSVVSEVTATLTQPGRREDLLPPLVRVTVKTIQGADILVVGTEILLSPPPASSFQPPQTWWCKVVAGKEP